MTLKGDLGTVGLFTVLQILETDSMTGMLQIKSRDKIAGLFLKDGSIAYATCSKSNSRLGYLLRSSGVITTEELEIHLALSKETNQALGKILVDEKVITDETLSEFVQKQAENIIYDLFFWETGDYEYKEMEINQDRLLLNKIHIMHVLLEASRRIDEMPVFKEQIPDDNLVFEKSGNIKSVVDELNEQEFSTLALVGCKNSVKQIIEKSGFDEFSVYSILNSLIVSGCIRPYEDKTPQEPVEKEVAQQEEQKEEQKEDQNSEKLQLESDSLDTEGTSPEDPDQTGDTKDDVSDEDEDQESKELFADKENIIPEEPEPEYQESFFTNVIYLFTGEKRFIAIGASIICLLVIVTGSIFVQKYIKTKRMETAYKNALMQAENKRVLEDQEKVLLNFLESNRENVHSPDVKKKIKEIRDSIIERNFNLADSKADELSQNENYAGARNVYQQYLDQSPKSVYVDEIHKKLAKVNSLLEAEEYGKLKDIAPEDYETRIIEYDTYLMNHSEGKHKEKVLSLISSAIKGYCNFLKAETRAGKNISINSLIFEKHKDRIISMSTDLMLQDEKLQINKLLKKGKKELKNSNYEAAINHFNKSLAVVRNSQLAAFPAYKGYENDILSALNDENLKYFQNGFFQFKGKWYALQEYENTIQKHGHVKDKGTWYSPDEYETLMISRGFYKYEDKYLTQDSFEKDVLVPVLKNKFNLEHWQKIYSIDLKLRGSNDNEIVYEIAGVSTANLEDYRVVINMSVDATFNKKNDRWRFFNPQKDSSLERYE